MEPYWDLFYQTGDPKAYVMYREEKLAAEGKAPEPSPTPGEEEFPWRRHPIL